MTESGEAQVLTVVRGGEPVALRFEIGAGLLGDWTLRLLRDGALDQAWSGTTGDRADDQLQLAPERLLAPEVRLEWIITVYGPAKDAGYDVGLRALQGRRRCIDFPPRRQGEVKARAAAIERGALLPRLHSPEAAR